MWHTENDAFEEGQWFHGRIYEQQSDLSPDGSLFLYRARKNETPEREASATTYKWTAISRPPYYTALALWPLGDDWGGGGMFLDNRTVWICHQSDHLKQWRHKKLTIHASFRPGRFSEKRIRDGWHLVQKGLFSFERIPYGRGLPVKGVTQQPTIWYKQHPVRRYRLIQEYYREPNFSFEALTYLVNEETNEEHLIEGTTWIDWDHRGRLVFARAGKLFASTDPAIPLQTQMIADFNANTPTSVIAPAWARQW
ncbi:MAG: hypothetical protein M3Z08_11620 [Chloroflexota bacterium]|nr:hypothetical protein [Chloroflexota bacterium]